MSRQTRKNLLIAAVAAVCAPAFLAQAADTGWNQTVGGTYDFNDTANWVGGNINGVWDSTLTLTGTQVLTMAGDTVLSDPLNFGYAGNFATSIYSVDTTTRNLTLGGDITVATLGGSTASVTLGSNTNNLNVNLNGNRLFTINTGRTLTFQNAVSNGNITTASAGTLRFAGQGGAIGSAITLTGGSTLNLFSGSSGDVGATRAASVKVLNGSLTTNGNSTQNSNETITGTVTIDGAVGGFTTITLSPNAARNARLTAGSLVRANNGVALIRGTNLGVSPIADSAAGKSNISLGTAPTLSGAGGASATHNMSILPWVVGSTNVNAAGGGAESFVTYDATNGLRPLDLTTEFEPSISDGTTTTNNVRLSGTGTLATITSDTTVNSLFLNLGTSASSKIDGSGTLKITSGALFLNVGTSGSASITINANLDFGSAQGVIGQSTAGKNRIISGNIAGTGGLVVYQPSQSLAGNSLALNGTGSTYTGDTYNYGKIGDVKAGVLPSGVRSGNIYNYGYISLTGGTPAINGLNGTGTVFYNHTGNATLTIGSDGSGGDYSGVIDSGSGANYLKLVKTGAGTQILGGTNTYYGSTTIDDGKLIVNGSLANSPTVTVNGAAAVLGGSGTINGNVVLTNGALAPGNSPGTITLGGLAMTANSVLSYDLSAANHTVGSGINDYTIVNGDLTLDGTINLTSPTELTNGVYTLVHYTGAFNDNGLLIGSNFGNGGGQTYSIMTDTNAGNVNLVVVPEPGTLVLGLGFGAMTLLGRKRRA